MDKTFGSSRPRAVTCHICGRGYGSSSLGIHLKACETKFLREESEKPASQRRPLPPRPSLSAGSGSGFSSSQNVPVSMDVSSLQAYNEAASATFSNMSACPNCSRRFLPDRLPIHLRSCTAASPARRVGAPLPGGGGGAFGGEDEEGGEEKYAPPPPAPAATLRPATAAAAVGPPRRSLSRGRAPGGGAGGVPQQQQQQQQQGQGYVVEKGGSEPPSTPGIPSSWRTPSPTPAKARAGGAGGEGGAYQQLHALRAEIAAVRAEYDARLRGLEESVLDIMAGLRG